MPRRTSPIDGRLPTLPGKPAPPSWCGKPVWFGVGDQLHTKRHAQSTTRIRRGSPGDKWSHGLPRPRREQNSATSPLPRRSFRAFNASKWPICGAPGMIRTRCLRFRKPQTLTGLLCATPLEVDTFGICRDVTVEMLRPAASAGGRRSMTPPACVYATDLAFEALDRRRAVIMVVVARIRQARRALGWTQCRLCEELAPFRGETSRQARASIDCQLSGRLARS